MNTKNRLFAVLLLSISVSGMLNNDISVKAEGETTAEGVTTLAITPQVSTPSILQVNSKTDKSVIVWENKDNCDGFEIWVKGNEKKKFKKVSSGRDTQFRIDKLKLGKVYKVKVRGYKNSNGKTVYGQYSNTLDNVITNVELKKVNAVDSFSAIVKWKKGDGVTGYDIQYSDNKKFKHAKTVNVKGNDSSDKVLYELKSKKTYYVRIRTYKSKNKKKYYSDWSNAKKCKVKDSNSIIKGSYKATDGFFKDSVFFGDSVLSGLGIYMKSKNKGYLDGAKVDGVVSYSLTEALKRDSKFHPLYKGQHMAPEKLAQAVGAKKVFLFFGINDVYNTKDPKGTYKKYLELIDRIKKNCPDVQIYILSTTYPVKDHEGSDILAKNLKKLNDLMRAYCEKSDCEYIDIASYVSTGDGYLKSQYCSDSFIHQQISAYSIWDKVLRNYAWNKKH
jgi:hypothetical protein